MKTETKYQAYDHVGPVGPPCITFWSALLEAANYDGWAADFYRLNENGDEDPAAPMGFYASTGNVAGRHWEPTKRDQWYGARAESDASDDYEAIVEVAAAIQRYAPRFHGHYDIQISKLSYVDGVLVAVDGRAVEDEARDIMHDELPFEDACVFVRDQWK